MTPYPFSVPIDEQYRLAELMVYLWNTTPPAPRSWWVQQAIDIIKADPYHPWRDRFRD